MSRTGSHAPAVVVAVDASDGSAPLPFVLQPCMGGRVASAPWGKHPRSRAPPTALRGCGMSDTTSAQSPGWVSVRLMDTSDVYYGRCGGCNELKHVMAGGTVAEHNGY